MKIVLEEIDKTSIIRYLEIKEINEIIIKSQKKIAKRIKKLKELETEKFDDLKSLQENLKFGTLRNRFWGRPSSIEEEIELRKMTGKTIDDIERLETEIKGIKKMEFTGVKLIEVLNFEKRLEIDEMLKIEIRLEKLGISEKTINAIKNLIIPKEYLYPVL